MKYVVSDQFAGGNGWTPDKFADAIRQPLADVGIVVERAQGHVKGGFQAIGLPNDFFKERMEQVGRIVRSVLAQPPLR